MVYSGLLGLLGLSFRIVLSTRDKREGCGPCITENMTKFLILTHSEIARQQEEKQRSTLWYKASSFLQQQFYTTTTTMRKTELADKTPSSFPVPDAIYCKNGRLLCSSSVCMAWILLRIKNTDFFATLTPALFNNLKLCI